MLKTSDVDQIKSQSFFVKNGEDALKTLLVNEIGNLSAQLKTAITEGVTSSVRAHIDQQIANSSTGYVFFIGRVYFA